MYRLHNTPTLFTQHPCWTRVATSHKPVSPPKTKNRFLLVHVTSSTLCHSCSYDTVSVSVTTVTLHPPKKWKLQFLLGYFSFRSSFQSIWGMLVLTLGNKAKQRLKEKGKVDGNSVERGKNHCFSSTPTYQHLLPKRTTTSIIKRSIISVSCITSYCFSF